MGEIDSPGGKPTKIFYETQNRPHRSGLFEMLNLPCGEKWVILMNTRTEYSRHPLP